MAIELHPDFLIQAHRGAGVAHPENTLEACEYTWDVSPWLIPECDVSTTLDGVLVAFHDSKLNRTGGNLGPDMADKGIREITWEKARTVDVGIGTGPQFANRYLPCLAAIFEKMKGKPERRLYLDHKRASLSALAELVRQSGVERQVIFCSSKLELVAEMEGSCAGIKNAVVDLERWGGGDGWESRGAAQDWVQSYRCDSTAYALLAGWDVRSDGGIYL